MSERIEAIKGNIIYAETPGELTVMPDSWIVTEGGIIRGIFSELPERYAAAEATDYGDMIITPAFTDLHLHAPQYPMLGLGMDLELLGWLNKYAFPTEAMFSDAGYARRVYSKLAHALIERGTTRVCIFSSLHREATNILMDELEKAGVTGYAGKVNMDRNGSEELIETTEESVAETRLFIEENKDRKLIKPILTPRFTPSCTNELMEELGKIAAEYPDIPVQSHLSENTDEMKWVKELHPDCAQYWETYDKYGLYILPFTEVDYPLKPLGKIHPGIVGHPTVIEHHRMEPVAYAEAGSCPEVLLPRAGDEIEGLRNGQKPLLVPLSAKQPAQLGDPYGLRGHVQHGQLCPASYV